MFSKNPQKLSHADNYRGECIVKLDGKIISKSQGGAVYAHGRGGRYNNYNRGNQNDWSNAAMKQNIGEAF